MSQSHYREYQIHFGKHKPEYFLNMASYSVTIPSYSVSLSSKLPIRLYRSIRQTSLFTIHGKLVSLLALHFSQHSSLLSIVPFSLTHISSYQQGYRQSSGGYCNQGFEEAGRSKGCSLPQRSLVAARSYLVDLYVYSDIMSFVQLSCLL